MSSKNHNRTQSASAINKTKPITKQEKGAVKDKRFQSATYDPKFVTPSSNLSKIKIDKRFSDKMKSEKFQMSGAVDKYGRANTKQTKLGGMDDYYYTNQDKQELEDQQIQEVNVKKGSKLEDKTKGKRRNAQVQSQIEEDEDNIAKWMENYNEESSMEDEEDVEDMLQESEGIWSEDEENVIKNDKVQATKRIALCNYDWMNINAKDLMILFTSFKPATGTITSVSVYYSEIGKSKMKLEELHGPQGIWNQKQKTEEEQVGKKKKYAKVDAFGRVANQEDAFDHKKLRQYEKQRLKYFYAVIECNNAKTADEIYKECDGNQFENSNLLFDLRFIPDDLKFDKSMLKEKCTQLPVAGEVKNFINRALGHSKVGLTWEDPELNSIASLKKRNWSKMNDKEIDGIDWGMYINEEADNANDDYDKVIGKREDLIDDEDDENQNMTDWRKQCNKKTRKQSDDLQISFPSGFGEHAKQRKQRQSLNKQMKTRKERWQANKDKKNEREKLEFLVDKDEKKDFTYNPEDTRFTPVFSDPKFSIDPSNPKFDHRKTGAVFKEVVQRNKKKNLL